MNIKWLIDLGATTPVIIIFIMGLMFAGYVFLRDRQKDRQIETLFSEIKQVRATCARLDTLGFGTAIAVQCMQNKEIKLIKQSADGDGNYTINRDVT